MRVGGEDDHHDLTSGCCEPGRAAPRHLPAWCVLRVALTMGLSLHRHRNGCPMKSSPFTPALLDLVTRARTETAQPLLFGNARIFTNDTLIGDIAHGDVLLGGARIVGVGPGLLTAADDDGAVVIDCTDHVIVPLAFDVSDVGGLREERFRPHGAIAPGNTAAFAIMPATADDSAEGSAARLARAPESASVVVIDGNVRVWDSVALPHPERTASAGIASSESNAAVCGTWVDESDFVHQHLTADGRYDETRGGRPHAYHGSYWVSGSRIDYRDDLGFWAFGEFADGVLHHAGYTFHRR